MQGLCDKTGFALPRTPATVDAWVAETLGRQPVVEDTVKSGGIEVSVKKMRRSKVFEVIVDAAAAAQPAP
jgi:CBS domain containing-hemolysin-like protein